MLTLMLGRRRVLEGRVECARGSVGKGRGIFGVLNAEGKGSRGESIVLVFFSVQFRKTIKRERQGSGYIICEQYYRSIEKRRKKGKVVNFIGLFCGVEFFGFWLGVRKVDKGLVEGKGRRRQQNGGFRVRGFRVVLRGVGLQGFLLCFVISCGGIYFFKC